MPPYPFYSMYTRLPRAMHSGSIPVLATTLRKVYLYGIRVPLKTNILGTQSPVAPAHGMILTQYKLELFQFSIGFSAQKTATIRNYIDVTAWIALDHIRVHTSSTVRGLRIVGVISGLVLLLQLFSIVSIFAPCV